VTGVGDGVEVIVEQGGQFHGGGVGGAGDECRAAVGRPGRRETD
jgi:hypothetical protein